MVTICTQCVDDGENGLVYCVDCLQLFGGNKPEESPESPAPIESPPPSPVTHDISPPSPVLAKPVEAAVWSGKFKVHGKEIGDFAAHLSDMAGPEADGAVKLLKPLVRFRKLEMSFMLPKDLDNSKFTDRSIDVFFFPSNESSQKALDELADDLLGYGKAMKALLGKAELLVFSSMELPRGQWRFKGKYFFWGIFRYKYVLKRKKENIEEDVNDDGTSEAAKNEADNVEEMEGTRRSKRTINKPIRMSSYHEGEY